MIPGSLSFYVITSEQFIPTGTQLCKCLNGTKQAAIYLLNCAWHLRGNVVLVTEEGQFSLGDGTQQAGNDCAGLNGRPHGG